MIDYVEKGLLKIEPFALDSISPSGYDLRSAISVDIKPKSAILIHTVETVELSPYICGQIFIRSSFAREGVFGSFAFVDPGFKGQLTLSISNFGDGTIRINAGEKVAQIVFMRLINPSVRPYEGKYQNSSGVVKSRRSF
ncbi:MAG: dCTP deaminase [Candidatus Methanomethyliales bacterium]|nr:dCTP deaminase [Candidatus Methanomethylicales archaeon]